MSGPDAGMRAVARVRAVREQDSRAGLRQALHEQRLHEARVADLRGRLEWSASFATGSVGSYLALRTSLEALGTLLRSAEDDVTTSRTISEAAYGRWQQDKARLSAVEVILEHRAAARRAEAARGEARDLDEVATRIWRRRAGGGGHP
ncbi:MAG TPA: flagellar FliJ family protein [Marmoricola sp.]